ncbi:MAG TPA: DUF302 domain-containing protein [Ktedonosporobacter sp.]|nr:DUF302 domain-containing protein [Ktedonosporobacter sp.]
MTTTSLTIQHTVVESKRSFEEVTRALEEQLGTADERLYDIGRQLIAANASWEEVTQAVEAYVGTSGFIIFGKTDHNVILALARKRGRAYQYVIGNPLLAVQMTQYQPEVALYAPTRLAVYEDHEKRTFVAYDSFTLQLAQYEHEEIMRMAQFVEKKLEALVAQAVGTSS